MDLFVQFILLPIDIIPYSLSMLHTVQNRDRQSHPLVAYSLNRIQSITKAQSTW